MKTICIFGPGKMFLGGISYYTFRLSNALEGLYRVTVVTLEKIVPRFLFPGAKRVGKNLTELEFNSSVHTYQGINWYWGRSLYGAINFINQRKPDLFFLQWWTSSVAHTYLFLRMYNYLVWKKPVVVLFHEVLDPFENSILPLRLYVSVIRRFLFSRISLYLVHSNSDKELVHRKFNIPLKKISIVKHGSYDNFKQFHVSQRPKPKSPICQLLFFGLIRPYKGVEYLIRAFNMLSKADVSKFHLTIVGETWENYTLPETLISESPYKDRIHFVNRYVSDREVDQFFSQADVAIFPYTRASQSGAAHIAMSYGLPVIVSRVGGLVESMASYEGTFFVDTKNVTQLLSRILESYQLKDQRFKDPYPWEETVKHYQKVFDAVIETQA